MTTKQQPLGTCDHCLGPIETEQWYTSKGNPRLYCSRDCRNTANSRAGAEERSRKAKQRIARGEWQNPAEINPPNPANISQGVSEVRQREVEEGRWRNPALDDEARVKLSRPRKHGDNPPLHRAIEKLGQGLRMANLTNEEAETYRAYRRSLEAARREEIRAYQRQRYRRRQAEMTDEEREAQQEKWRAANRRRQRKNKKTSA